MTYENTQIEILPLSDFIGKTVEDVYEHCQKTYPGRLLGQDYRDWLYENPGKAPKELQDTNPYFFFLKEKVRHANGRWNVPCVSWDGAKFRRSGSWLGDGWGARCRVVLLKTPVIVDPLLGSVPLDPLICVENLRKGDKVRVVGNEVRKVKICGECNREL